MDWQASTLLRTIQVIYVGPQRAQWQFSIGSQSKISEKGKLVCGRAIIFRILSVHARLHVLDVKNFRKPPILRISLLLKRTDFPNTQNACALCVFYTHTVQYVQRSCARACADAIDVGFVLFYVFSAYARVTTLHVRRTFNK